MFAQAFVVQYPPDKLEQATREFRERVLPKLRQVTGYSGAMSLVEPKSGRILELTFWTTEYALRVGEQLTKDLRAEIRKGARSGARPLEESYQVAQSDGFVSEYTVNRDSDEPTPPAGSEEQAEDNRR